MIDFIKTGSEQRRAATAAGPGQRPHAGLRHAAHRRADRSHRRLRAEPVMTSLDLLAIGWEPELRGILTVIIGVVVLCGSIYLILAPTSAPASASSSRSPALFGWMVLMGIDLVDLRHRPEGPRAVVGGGARHDGAAGHERAVPGRRPRRCRSTSPRTRRSPRRPSSSPSSSSTRAGSRSTSRHPSSARRRPRPACSSRRTGAFEAGEFEVVNVFDIGGERYPKINDIARLPRLLPRAALRRSSRSPRSSRCATEPGRAPAPPRSTRPASTSTCYMVRDLGARRQPAVVLTIGVGDHLPRAVLAAAPPRALRCATNRSQPRPGRRSSATARCRDEPVPADRRAAGPRRRCSARSASSPRACSRRAGRRRPRKRRTSAASCRSREPPERFPVSFYVVAMLFIMFDIEIIFIYPYAVSQRRRSASTGSGRSSCSRWCSSSRSCTRSPAAGSTGARSQRSRNLHRRRRDGHARSAR